MISKKIGRNDPCWCGSGRKYKKCHLGREFQNEVPGWKISKEFRSRFSKKICSAPESYHEKCSLDIVQAHTVPKSLSLKSISRNGHVYGLISSLEKIKKNEGTFIPELIGINTASTFTGFCSIHDDSIFAPIEKREFSRTPEQCFLLAYRSLAREYYMKVGQKSTVELVKKLDKGKSINNQIDIQTLASLVNIGVIAAIRDIKQIKGKFDKYLEERNFDFIRGIVLELDSLPPIMVCGGVNPYFDFNGKKIQDLSDLEKPIDMMSITSYYDGKKGLIVFAWLEESPNACTALITSLLGKKKEYIVPLTFQYIFKNIENFYISPDWWENAETEDKYNIEQLIADTISMEREPNSNGITSVFLKTALPNLTSISFVNFTI